MVGDHESQSCSPAPTFYELYRYEEIQRGQGARPPGPGSQQGARLAPRATTADSGPGATPRSPRRGRAAAARDGALPGCGTGAGHAVASRPKGGRRRRCRRLRPALEARADYVHGTATPATCAAACRAGRARTGARYARPKAHHARWGVARRTSSPGVQPDRRQSPTRKPAAPRRSCATSPVAAGRDRSPCRPSNIGTARIAQDQPVAGDAVTAELATPWPAEFAEARGVAPPLPAAGLVAEGHPPAPIWTSAAAVRPQENDRRTAELIPALAAKARTTPAASHIALHICTMANGSTHERPRMRSSTAQRRSRPGALSRLWTARRAASPPLPPRVRAISKRRVDALQGAAPLLRAVRHDRRPA